jgi:hypothetical protein
VKTTVAYYLLILYTIALCKPVLPLVKDKLAHIFWEAEHIATVHHHHGDHHAEEEIAIATHEEDSDTAPPVTKISKSVSIHLIVESLCTSPQFFIGKPKFGAGISNASSLYLDKYYPPPKSC